MSKYIKITKLYSCLLLIITSSFIPLKVFAVSTDYDFYNANDILYYDPSTCTSGSSSSNSIGSAAQTDSLESFVDAYGQMAFDVGKKYGIPYEAILAQGILESGYGESGLTQKANNFFGIKAGDTWTGETINMETGEVYDGESVTVDATFRKYPTPEAGWEGYGDFILTNSRYEPALAFPGDYIAYITAIWEAGYATDPEYVEKVGSLANSIATYIASTGKWPPSSEVAKTNIPTVTNGGSATTTPTSTSSNCSGGTAADATIDTAHLYEDSTSIKCAAGTTDAGIQEGYVSYNKVMIQTCSIPGTLDDDENLSSPREMVVNSRVSGAWLALINDMKSKLGINTVDINSSFRTMDMQTADKARYGSGAAAPGDSLHQSGLAIDFGPIYGPASWDKGSQPYYDYLSWDGNGAKFGMEQQSGEAWHWQPID